MKKIRSLAIAGLFALSAASASAATVVENFSTDPLQNGWQAYGDTNLFQWDATNQNLAVTWDSSQTNSYIYRPLGRTFTKADGFCVQFDLNLADAQATGYFELAIGLCNLSDATSADFSRANYNSPNLCEFDYFPGGPESWGPSIDATLIDGTGGAYFAFNTNGLPTNTTLRVSFIHPAGASSVSCQISTNGQPFLRLDGVYSGSQGDFHLDTLAICNYTTLDDTYGDALLAHGTVDNVSFTSPLPVEKITTPAAGNVRFASDARWFYTLQRTADFSSWTNVSLATAGNGTNMILQDTNMPPEKSVYRVRAELP